MFRRFPLWGRLKAIQSSRPVAVTHLVRCPLLINSVQLSLLLSEPELLRNREFYPFTRQSLIPGAGLGLFINGKVSEGDSICIYPGTVYQPFEPIWLASINNHYILSCFDGVLIDAKPAQLSRIIYKSVRNRVRFGDLNWLSQEVPFALGHYANNGGVDTANARYQELILPPASPTCNLHVDTEHDPNYDEIRTVVLVATRDLHNEEVLVSYHEMIE